MERIGMIGLEERRWIEAEARAIGFDVAGCAAVTAEGEERFEAWIGKGNAGEMGWLERRDAAGALIRADVRRSLPWARSVVVCASNYNAEGPRSIDPHPEGTGWIARYAWGGRERASAMGESGFAELGGSDYHDVLMGPLRELEARLAVRFVGVQTKSYVDTGPILERNFAQAAGVGWIGRHTCVINQGMGSWLLLGVVITSLELEAAGLPVVAADRCGSCRRCIEACPTGALDESGIDGGMRTMEATKCIAYLTIEKKGDVPAELRAGMGRQVFGCDICQEVCPWNRKAPVSGSGWFPTRGEMVNPSLEELAGLDGVGFNARFRGTPLERTRRRRVQRNVAIAMGNSGKEDFRERLTIWAEEEDPMLAEAASWGLGRLQDD